MTEPIAPGQDARLHLGFTHIALQVHDLRASVDFYQRYAGLTDIHHRGSGQAGVAWVSDLKRPFGIVLLQRRGGRLTVWLGRMLGLLPPPLAHIGIELESRDAVDGLCRQAAQEGILRKPPRDAGFPVGYYGMVADPDGNNLELSCGQYMGEVLVANIERRSRQAQTATAGGSQYG